VIGANAERVSMAHMQPSAPATSNRFEKHLEGLREHSTLGRPVRFYFRRREQVLYLVVGGWNTVFGYGAWALLQYLLGDHLHYLVVVVLAWPIAVLNAYLGYRYLVFRSRGPVLRELPRFSLVYLATLVVNLALLPVALHMLAFNIYVVQALFAVGVVVCSYLGHKYFSFRGGHSGDAGDASSHDPTAASKD
jgi:putative flippase GtrA